MVLPRRSFTPLLGRLLHDRTADKIAAAVSHIPHAAATIVPFDVRGRLEKLSQRNGQPDSEPEPPAQDHRRGRGAPAPAMPGPGPGHPAATRRHRPATLRRPGGWHRRARPAIPRRHNSPAPSRR